MNYLVTGDNMLELREGERKRGRSKGEKEGKGKAREGINKEWKRKGRKERGENNNTVL